MTMNRVIHQAVRRDLLRAEQALRDLTPGDRARAGELLRAWEHLHDQLHHHHTVEDELIWPFLRSRGATGPHVDAMEGEHHAMADALTDARTAMVALVEDPTRQRADEAAVAVARADEVTCRHLDHEEAEVEPLIIELEEDPGWKGVEKDIRKAANGRAGQMFAWVQDGASPETSTWLRTQIPAPVMFVFGHGRGARRYRREIAPVWR